jgi:carbon-monoxide dehydrogenase medium subunit
MLALDASFVLAGARGERVVKADGYFVGVYATQARADEILTQIRIPVPPAGCGWSYSKLKRKTGDFATAAAAVLLQMKGGKVAAASIALTNVAPTPIRARQAEQYLAGKAVDEASLTEAARLAMGACSPASCPRGTPDYKTAMAGEMTRRALQAAQARAKP